MGCTDLIIYQKLLPKTVPFQSSSEGGEISGRMMMLDRDWVELQIISRHVLYRPIIIFHSCLNISLQLRYYQRIESFMQELLLLLMIEVALFA